MGPTASGKSAIGLAVARYVRAHQKDVEIVSVDSMQVYRGMDIGTAKPDASEQQEFAHHMIDICDPNENYTVARFQRECRSVLTAIANRGNCALLIGGTGLYLRSLTDDLQIPGRFPEVKKDLEENFATDELFVRLQQLDPVAAARMEPTNRRRIVRALEVTIGSGQPFSSFGPGLETHIDAPFAIVGLEIDRTTLDERISARYEAQLAAGFVGECERLLTHGVSRTAAQALGYREIFDHLQKGIPLDEAMELAVTRTRKFARRQQRWFRRDPRIEWIPTTGEVDENCVALLGQRLIDY